MREETLTEAGDLEDRSRGVRNARVDRISYFILTVLGFSFWFFMAVPFASHRETYSWLAGMLTHHFVHALSFISFTYRRLGQAATWLSFLMLNPSIFPTSVLRQTLFQGFIYGMFVLGWWLIYKAAPQRRLFAVIAFVAGGFFFSGYVHLFHLYGLFYVPVMLILGAILMFHNTRSFDKKENWLAVVATLLVFWHPFVTALFVGDFFGFYLETFRRRTRPEHIRAVVILLVPTMAIATLVILIPRFWPGVPLFIRDTAATPLHTRWLGFLISYRTNEVNLAASGVAFLLSLITVLSMELSRWTKWVTLLLVSAFSGVFLLAHLPVLLVWVGAVLLKLVLSRSWALFFLALTATLFPVGGVIGAPIFALFAIVIGVYVTAMGWSEAENALAFFKPRYVLATAGTLAIIVLLVRVGVNVPVVTKAAHPLLAERERTYELEDILAWLHHSGYCGDEIAFNQTAGSPIDSLRNVLNRRNRPPASLHDVELFWNSALRCNNEYVNGSKASTALITFGGQVIFGFRRVFEIGSRYAGDATVWIRDPQKQEDH